MSNFCLVNNTHLLHCMVMVESPVALSIYFILIGVSVGGCATSTVIGSASGGSTFIQCGVDHQATQIAEATGTNSRVDQSVGRECHRTAADSAQRAIVITPSLAMPTSKDDSRSHRGTSDNPVYAGNGYVKQCINGVCREIVTTDGSWTNGPEWRLFAAIGSGVGICNACGNSALIVGSGVLGGLKMANEFAYGFGAFVRLHRTAGRMEYPILPFAEIGWQLNPSFSVATRHGFGVVERSIHGFSPKFSYVGQFGVKLTSLNIWFDTSITQSLLILEINLLRKDLQ